ncbi:calcium-dependent protein kinase 3-like isoform X1 [Gossypium australe]|uniref:Calcium-dependent protein kinase 3-like isoform X1 n=1 Tax=Gossypium australe TaxID=47621 RepID=A0A5B6W2R3_9ROSI|nr:calcium-dependent protein kinase 3-like isoform X1 [Gossypium australe]
MFPNKCVHRSTIRDRDSKNSGSSNLINKAVDQLLISGSQGSFQMLTRSPLPTRHSIPSSIKSRALQMLRHVKEG